MPRASPRPECGVPPAPLSTQPADMQQQVGQGSRRPRAAVLTALAALALLTTVACRDGANGGHRSYRAADGPGGKPSTTHPALVTEGSGGTGGAAEPGNCSSDADCSNHGKCLYGNDCSKPCNCSTPGSDGTRCNQTTGKCTCKDNFEGLQCATCVAGYFGNDCSKSCDCSTPGSDGTSCDQTSGQCVCQIGFNGTTCSSCTNGNFGENCSTPCDCSKPGSESASCDQTSGQCTCAGGFNGTHCDSCAQGLSGPTCTLSCTCSELGTCDGQTSASTSTGRCVPGSCIGTRTTGPNCEQSKISSIDELQLNCTAGEMKLDLGARYIQVTYVYQGTNRTFKSNLQLQLGGSAAASITCSQERLDEAVFVDISWYNSRLWQKTSIYTDPNTNANSDTDTKAITSTSQTSDSLSAPSWQLLTPHMTFRLFRGKWYVQRFTWLPWVGASATLLTITLRMASCCAAISPPPPLPVPFQPPRS